MAQITFARLINNGTHQSLVYCIFKKTFTSDEMSSLRWTKFDQLKELIKNVHINMTWKDCPIECATLFHSRFENFIQKYILSNKDVIGKVEPVIQL
jgi:hypothetical protein